MSLTEVQRAQATYNLIIRKTEKYQSDLAKYQETSAGKIDLMKTSWTNLTTELGENVIPIFAKLSTIITDIDNHLTSFIDHIQNSKLPELILKARDAGLIDPTGWALEIAWAEAMTAARTDSDEKDIKKQMQERIAQVNKTDEELQGHALEFGNDLETIEKDYEEDLKENWKDYQQDKQDITMDYIEKGVEIEKDYGDRLKDLQSKLTDDIAKAWSNYYDDVANVNQDYNQDLQDAADDYHQKQLDAEEDFQRKMRDLRQKFLFDLEDAIRERDAKQAMLLIRQYNYDKQQAQQDKTDKYEDMKTDYKRELDELKKQKARKLAELRDQLNKQLADIQIEYNKELAELNTWKAEEYAARETWYDKELALAESQWKTHNEEAAQARRDDIFNLVNSYNKQYSLTVNQWDRMLTYVGQIIGQDGTLTKALEAFAAYSESLLSQAFSITPPSSTLTPSQNFHWGGSYANGGQITVSKPTLAMFGERGTETATFTKGAKSSSKGELGIRLYLSDELRAEIVDDALGEFENVLVSIERTQR